VTYEDRKILAVIVIAALLVTFWSKSVIKSNVKFSAVQQAVSCKTLRLNKHTHHKLYKYLSLIAEAPRMNSTSCFVAL